MRSRVGAGKAPLFNALEETEIAFQRGGAVRDDAEQVRHDAKLLFDGFEQRPRQQRERRRSWRELGYGT